MKTVRKSKSSGGEKANAPVGNTKPFMSAPWSKFLKLFIAVALIIAVLNRFLGYNYLCFLTYIILVAASLAYKIIGNKIGFLAYWGIEIDTLILIFTTLRLGPTLGFITLFFNTVAGLVLLGTQVEILFILDLLGNILLILLIDSYRSSFMSLVPLIAVVVLRDIIFMGSTLLVYASPEERFNISLNIVLNIITNYWLLSTIGMFILLRL